MVQFHVEEVPEVTPFTETESGIEAMGGGNNRG